MAWLIVANMLVVTSLTVAACPQSLQATAHKQVTGTCASIGYDTKCCPPSGECQAKDGDCQCDAACHLHENCCDDAACPQYPRICKEYGITSCCNSTDTECRAFLYGHNPQIVSKGMRCSCDNSSCGVDSCCVDSATLCAKTCTEAEIEHNCTWSNTTSCYVEAGDCYCDTPCCTNHKDCCEDITEATTQNPMTFSDNKINHLLIDLLQKQDQESKAEYESIKEQLLNLVSLAQDTEVLNDFIQYNGCLLKESSLTENKIIHYCNKIQLLSRS